MSCKITVLRIALTAMAIQVVVGTELIEMNDANKNQIPLSLSKSVAVVQKAYQNEFNFETIRDVRKFLADCELVKGIMQESKNSDFGGLAEKIKAVMDIPSIKLACSVTNDQLTADFDMLDRILKEDEYDYLSPKKFDELARLNNVTNANEALKGVVENVIKQKAGQLADGLLKDAAYTATVRLGETETVKVGWFDTEERYKEMCETEAVGPICKLVRRSRKKVDVIAEDLDDFASAFEKKDEAMIDRYTKASGVSVNYLERKCPGILSFALRPVELIWRHVAAGYVSEEKVRNHMEADQKLDNYNSLRNLCLVVVGKQQKHE